MTRNTIFFALVVCMFHLSLVQAQPRSTEKGVQFKIVAPNASFVSLVGDFNGWSNLLDSMHKEGDSVWVITRDFPPGTYQYGFSIDGQRVITDPGNPHSFEDYETRQARSVFTVTESGSVQLVGYPERKYLNDEYPAPGGTLYLALVWRLHKPMYYNFETDQIEAPFVRTAATREYFDMASIAGKYSNIHITVVFSPSLLWQLQHVYVDRAKDFIKRKKRKTKFYADGFYARYKGKTDPWIDLALKPASRFTEADRNRLYNDKWGVFSLSPIYMSRFPELYSLYEKWLDSKGKPDYTTQEIRDLKFWAIFAHFDPEFYERKIPLSRKHSVDFRDLISFRSDGKYYLKHKISEDDCKRVVGDAFKIMMNIIPKYQRMQYNPATKLGQIEIAGTSFYEANLPLVINSAIAAKANPSTKLPGTFAFPGDAKQQIQQGLELYKEFFNKPVLGFIPLGGAISPEVLPMLANSGYKWFVSDDAVLARSTPSDLPAYKAYAVKAGNTLLEATFSNADLANRIVYVYRNYYSENAADNFVKILLDHAPTSKTDDRLVTVVIDGDDHWPLYRNDMDGKGFVGSLYRKLDKLYKKRSIVTVTISEYFSGNRRRRVPAHPAAKLATIQKLASGSKINGNFDTWIGEESINNAWNVLRKAREDFEKAGLTISRSNLAAARSGTGDWYAAAALHSLLALEGGDWFRSFSDAQALSSNPKRYEKAFMNHIAAAYRLAGKAGFRMKMPEYQTIVTKDYSTVTWTKPTKRTRVMFTCTLRDREAITAVYIVGNRPELGNKVPNKIAMHDNGEYGDRVAGDNIWTIVLDLEEGDIEYKYTNSGGEGTWEGSEAFPGVWRTAHISGDKMFINDIFGVIKNQ